MKKLFVFAVLTIEAVIPAIAQEFDDWTVGFGQGYLEHIVRNGPGNELNISCDIGATENHERTAIFVQILGKNPPPESEVRFILDAKETRLFADKYGSIETDCHACSDNFQYLWRNIRKAKSMLVQFSDGRSSPFSLKGASKALDPEACNTGYTG